MAIRVFHLVRNEDESGVSGTGTVGEVIEFSDGTCVVRWLSNMASTNIYQNFKQVDSIHGHGGKTRLVMVYDENPIEESEETPEPEPEEKKSTRKRQSKKDSKK